MPTEGPIEARSLRTTGPLVLVGLMATSLLADLLRAQRGAEFGKRHRFGYHRIAKAEQSARGDLLSEVR